MQAGGERPFIIRHFTSLTRIFGLFTSAGRNVPRCYLRFLTVGTGIFLVKLTEASFTALWWTGVYMADSEDKRIAAYLMICGLAVTFFEVAFILDKCSCCREESCAHTLWKYLLAVDNWKKSLLYASLSIVCYLHPDEYWQALISGVFLDVTALMYLIRTFRTRNEKEPYKYKQLEVK